MFGRFCVALALTGAIMASSVSPALARHWDDDGYYERDGPDRHEYRDEHYRRVYYRPRYAYYDQAPRGQYYRHRYHRCSSGTTGAIVGGVLGGLLGREVGRGGRWNEPSTTGLIVGAGAGALAGRAIERDRCR